jgi:hypothetical protein
MGQNNQKLIMRNFIIKVMLITRNNIYHSLVYLEGHLSNYLITSGKYPTYHLLFIKDEAI